MKPKVCISLMEDDIDSFIRAAGRVTEGDLIEIRADGLKESSAPIVKRLLRSIKVQNPLPIILTNRMESCGGIFSGDEHKRMEILLESLDLCDFVDIELNSDNNLRDEIIKSAREKRKGVIVSHYLNNVSDDLAIRNLVEREFNIGASIAKLFVKISNKAELLKILKMMPELRKLGKICIIPITNEKFPHIAMLYFGSEIAYVYSNRPTFEGQLSFEEFKRIMELMY